MVTEKVDSERQYIFVFELFVFHFLIVSHTYFLICNKFEQHRPIIGLNLIFILFSSFIFIYFHFCLEII